MRKPPWVLPATRDPAGGDALPRLLRGPGFATICESARRPNQGECLGGGTAAFLALGDARTRRCGFCAVAKGAPPPDPGEPAAVAAVAAAERRLGLEHAAAGPPVHSSCRARELRAG